MSSLRFFCATYEKEFDGGFEVDDDTFHRHRLKLVACACPHCGRTHRFLLADARGHLPAMHDARPETDWPPTRDAA